MTKKTEVAGASKPLDTAKLLLAVAVLLGSMFAYYVFDHWHLVARVLMVVAGVMVATGLLYLTTLGESWFKYLVNTRKEVRQVVWPTRKETVQTTLIVVVAVIIVGIFLWLVDMFFLWAVKLLTGQGG